MYDTKGYWGNILLGFGGHIRQSLYGLLEIFVIFLLLSAAHLNNGITSNI